MACNPAESLPEEDQPVDGSGTTDSGARVRGVDTGGRSIDPQVDTYVPYDAGPSWSYGTCAALYGCVAKACNKGGANCDKVCVDKASATAQERYLQYGKCLNDACLSVVCKDSADPACAAKCAAERCAGVLLACFADGKTGGNGCTSTWVAEQACTKASDGFKCLTDSYKTLDSDAQAAWIAMQLCLAGTLAKDPWDVCLAEVLACSSDGKKGPNACWQLLDCEATCATAPHLYQCLGACYALGDQPGKAGYLAVKACVRSAAAGQAGAGQCYAAMSECAEPAGTTTCAQAWACINTCKGKTGKQELYCVGGCLHDADVPAASAFTAWWGCREAACKPKCGKDKTCLDGCYASECGTLQSACLGK